jgi:hypothetical protein
VKKSLWTLYLVVVHIALALAVSAFVWVRYFDRGMPASLEWVGGANELTNDQRAIMESMDPNWEDTKYAYVRANGNSLAMLTFQDDTLESMDIAWPGDRTVWTLKETRSLLTHPSGIEPEDYADTVTFGMDMDGDRMIDYERHELERGTRVYRRVRQHRYDLRVNDLGTEHILYNRQGDIAARVTDDPSKNIIIVEYKRDGATVATDSIERDAYSIDALSDKIWDSDTDH